MAKEPLDQKKQQQMLILIGVGSIVVLVVYLNFLLMPHLRSVVDALGKAKKTSAELKKTELEIAKKEDLLEKVEDYKMRIGGYQKTLPSESGIPTLLEDLSNMARASNMRIVAITPVATKEDRSRAQAYEEIPIMISAKSGYHELGRFLASLENCDRFVKVADLQIKANKASPKKHDVELLITTYVMTEGK